MNKLIEEMKCLRSSLVVCAEHPDECAKYINDCIAIVKKHMEPQLIITTDGSPEAVKFVAEAIGSDMCVCGHDIGQHTYNSTTCGFDKAKGEGECGLVKCYCTKFTPQQEQGRRVRFKGERSCDNCLYDNPDNCGQICDRGEAWQPKVDTLNLVNLSEIMHHIDKRLTALEAKLDANDLMPLIRIIVFIIRNDCASNGTHAKAMMAEFEKLEGGAR